MERLDQSSSSSIRAPETDVSRPGLEPPTFCTAGRHSSTELSRQLTLFTIRNLYRAAPVHVAITHGLVPGAQARM
jgi:hypothetical protein